MKNIGITYLNGAPETTTFDRIQHIAMMYNKKVTQNPHTFNHAAVYKVSGEHGLYTLNELERRFLA